VSAGWVDAGWTIAAGALTVAVIVVVLVLTEKLRAPIVRDDDTGTWRAAPRYGRQRR
jgi:hypothetical protein